ncbi:Crossover junction endonuclease mus81 [Phlyctochytrium planicorne]|nr:Crossover junction endonuclease mus81 [Phlyctochytrium planicorne]
MSDIKHLLLEWLYDMHEEERKASMIRPSHMRNFSVYKKAYDEMKKYPSALRTPQEAIQIKNIGPAIVKQLERRFNDYKSQHPEFFEIAMAAAPPPAPAPTPAPAPAPQKGPSQKPEQSRTSTKAKASSSENPEVVKKTKAHTGSSRARLEKQYIPKYRSASWAILIVLRAHGRSAGYMSKSEVIKHAQQHCDTPFISASMYNGWSSMALLIEKDLVARYGNPPRFCLTEEGKALADKIEESVRIMNGRAAAGVQPSGLLDEENREGFVFVDPNRDELGNEIGSFWYLAAHNSRAQLKSDAAVQFIGGRRTVMVEFPGDEPENYSRSITDPIHLPSGNILGFLEDIGLPDASPAKSIDVEEVNPKPSERTPSNIMPQSVLQRSKTVTFLAGTFEVVALLDNREVSSGISGVERQYFQTGLREKSVLFETRKLELGDILWVARSKYGNDDEIVLDCILERKTLDDLVASIKDGRFKEQKFRLRECGVRHIIYLVEESNTENAEVFGMASIHTAFTQVQMEDGFFLKRTTSSEESLSYIAGISRQLTQCFSRENLTAERISELAKPEWFSRCRHIENMRLITFQDFSRLNSKSKNLVLKDIWTRQLMTVSGISAEKAIAISSEYSTCSRFMAALKNCKTDVERENLIKNIGEIMEVIYKRLQEPPSPTWRQTYKVGSCKVPAPTSQALQLLEYLIKNGSERVIDNAREHVYELKALRNFNYVDEKAKDQGINVRQRAKEIIDLLGDNAKIKEERRKAKENRAKYTGVSNQGYSGSSSRYGGMGSDSRAAPVVVAKLEPKPAASFSSVNQVNLLDISGDDWGDFSSAAPTTNSTSSITPKTLAKNDDFADFSDFQSAPIAAVPVQPVVTNVAPPSSFANFSAAPIPKIEPISPPNASFADFSSFQSTPAQKIQPLMDLKPLAATAANPTTATSTQLDPFAKLVSLDANSLSGLGKKAPTQGPSLNSINPSPISPQAFPAFGNLKGVPQPTPSFGNFDQNSQSLF